MLMNIGRLGIRYGREMARFGRRSNNWDCELPTVRHMTSVSFPLFIC